MEELDLFASQLQNLRKLRGLSQSALAKQTGVPQATISRWETGEAEPGLLGIKKLATFFDVSADVICSLAAPPDKMRPGNWLLDVDALEQRQPGDAWAVAIPERFRIVTSSEYQSLRKELEGRKKR